MFKRSTAPAVLLITLLIAGIALSQTIEENWNDFLHYTKIARLELAKGYARNVLDADPDPVDLLTLSRQDPTGYDILLRMNDTAADAELVAISGKILALIEKGAFIHRTDPKIIVAEIKRLSISDRGGLAATKRLRNAGEYAIMYMLDAMADPQRKEELPNIVATLPRIGRDAIRPLAAALQTNNTAVRAEIIRALGKIAYPQALGYLKYMVENDPSAELKSLAVESISRIDPAALNLTAARLFYQLAENYYYKSESLAPAQDANFANIWFWDADQGRLIRREVDKSYFYELMAMRACEWSLKADPDFGQAIGLWIASFFKAESADIEMPEYFGDGHAPAIVYATTAGPEYLHQALARAVKDKNSHVALGTIEALAEIAGEKSLLYTVGPAQPLAQALVFENKAVRYSAAIAIAAAAPRQGFPESGLVLNSLTSALAEPDESIELENEWVSQSYAFRAASVMRELATAGNPVIDLSLARSALINATKDQRPEIQILVGQTLAVFNNVDAQRAIAAMSLAEANSLAVRVAAFNALAESAKLNANLLDDGTVDSIYSLVSATDDVDPELRSAAAAAYGALNLPSRKVKDLVLDQAKS